MTNKSYHESSNLYGRLSIYSFPCREQLNQAVGAAFSVCEGFSKARLLEGKELPCTPPALFQWCLEQGADVLLTVKSNQKKLYRQFGSQFKEKRDIPYAPPLRQPNWCSGVGLPAQHRGVDKVGLRPYLLLRAGYRSIRGSLRELAYDIKGMLARRGMKLDASES